ncbi:hypothetical protein L2E82_19634 [Cichorium intybus]|uniref:Uncharacterized protein n=1 Tax=Cichorium intybus TaxID=13427 RepID=A0ACB9FD60_CICIN|nr:hypothetical protein L2E82_19634 [Cichorium intybus]
MYPQCLECYASIRVFTSLLPNQFTVPIVVSAFAELGDLVLGMIVHGLVLKDGTFQETSAVGSSFVYMYSKCGYVENARQVFDEMRLRDVVAWTALVIEYIQNGESDKGLKCVCDMYKMSGDDEKPNSRTLEGGFQACGDLDSVYSGRCLHGVALKSGLTCSIALQSSIFSMYSKCGTLEEAYMSFSEVPVKDIKLWTSIINVYGKLGNIKQCLSGFIEMLSSGINPDPMVPCIEREEFSRPMIKIVNSLFAPTFGFIINQRKSFRKLQQHPKTRSTQRHENTYTKASCDEAPPILLV